MCAKSNASQWMFLSTLNKFPFNKKSKTCGGFSTDISKLLIALINPLLNFLAEIFMKNLNS